MSESLDSFDLPDNNSEVDVEYLENENVEEKETKKKSKRFLRGAKAVNIMQGLLQSHSAKSKIKKGVKPIIDSAQKKVAEENANVEADESGISASKLKNQKKRTHQNTVLRSGKGSETSDNISLRTVKSSGEIGDLEEEIIIEEDKSPRRKMRDRIHFGGKQQNDLAKTYAIERDIIDVDIDDEDKKKSSQNTSKSAKPSKTAPKKLSKKDQKKDKKKSKAEEDESQNSSTDESDIEVYEEEIEAITSSRKLPKDIRSRQGPTLKELGKNIRNMNKLSFKRLQNDNSKTTNEIDKKESMQPDVIEVDFDLLGLPDIQEKNKGKKVIINKKQMKEAIKYPDLERIEEREEPHSDHSLGYGKFPPTSYQGGKDTGEVEDILDQIQHLQVKMIQTGGIRGLRQTRAPPPWMNRHPTSDTTQGKH